MSSPISFEPDEPQPSGPTATAPTTPRPPEEPIVDIPNEDISSWISCEDGRKRQGPPPDDWILTARGCYMPPGSGPTNSVDLRQVVNITPSVLDRIERSYVIGSGVALEPHRLTFFNQSTNMSVIVKLTGPLPLKFVVGQNIASDSFELQPQQGRQVDIQFLQAELNKLPEGVVQSDILVTLAAGTVTIAKDQEDIIFVTTPVINIASPITPPPASAPTVAPTPTWKDGTSGTIVVREGFPPVNYILRSDGVYVAPMAPLVRIAPSLKTLTL